jgi:hypothetical protein
MNCRFRLFSLFALALVTQMALSQSKPVEIHDRFDSTSALSKHVALTLDASDLHQKAYIQMTLPTMDRRVGVIRFEESN